MSNTVFRKIWQRLHPEVQSRVEGYEATAEIHARLADAIEARDEDAAREISLGHLTEYHAWVATHQPTLLTRLVDWTPTPS